MAFGLGSSQVIFTFVYVIVRSVLRLLVVPFRWELPLKSARERMDSISPTARWAPTWRRCGLWHGISLSVMVFSLPLGAEARLS